MLRFKKKLIDRVLEKYSFENQLEGVSFFDLESVRNSLLDVHDGGASNPNFLPWLSNGDVKELLIETLSEVGARIKSLTLVVQKAKDKCTTEKGKRESAFRDIEKFALEHQKKYRNSIFRKMPAFDELWNVRNMRMVSESNSRDNYEKKTEKLRCSSWKKHWQL